MLPLLIWSWPETPISVAAVIVVAIVLRFLAVRAIKATVEASVTRARGRSAGHGTRADRILAAAGLMGVRHEARARTIGTILRSAVTIAIICIATLTILDGLGAPLGALIASAGIGSVAIGFGAQSLVKDILSGMFMIMEDQFGVGDLVDTGDVCGTVEDIGLRTTRLRDGSGQVWYVHNGSINRIGNRSQGWSTVSIDLPIAYDEDPTRAISLLNDTVDSVFADERWEDVLLERPEVVGVDKVHDASMTLRIMAKCAPDKNWAVQRDILERSQQALRAAGVRGPAFAD